MKTASFFTYSGPGRVSIARFWPRNTAKGFRGLKDLAPGTWFNSVQELEYLELFRTEILARLDPKETWEKIHALHGDGVEPVLLCWETAAEVAKAPATYCHRALCARWFSDAIGVAVDEIGFEGGPHPMLPRSMRVEPQRSLAL